MSYLLFLLEGMPRGLVGWKWKVRLTPSCDAVLAKLVPDAAMLAAKTLLPQFPPKLGDVAAPLEQAFVQIFGVGVDCAWIRTWRAFGERAGAYPSLHGAKT